MQCTFYVILKVLGKKLNVIESKTKQLAIYFIYVYPIHTKIKYDLIFVEICSLQQRQKQIYINFNAEQSFEHTQRIIHQECCIGLHLEAKS